jgi:hypothetical protein
MKYDVFFMRGWEKVCRSDLALVIEITLRRQKPEGGGVAVLLQIFRKYSGTKYSGPNIPGHPTFTLQAQIFRENIPGHPTFTPQLSPFKHKYSGTPNFHSTNTLSESPSSAHRTTTRWHQPYRASVPHHRLSITSGRVSPPPSISAASGKLGVPVSGPSVDPIIGDRDPFTFVETHGP